METCPECGNTDIKPTTSGPLMQIPMYECRICGCLEFDCGETLDPWLPNWTPPVRAA